jgi:hypothetical protein
MCKSRETIPFSLHFWNLPTLPDGFFKTHIDKFHEKNFPVHSVSDPNPDHSMGSWIRIRIANAESNPDPEGEKSAQNEEKLSVKTRKNYKNLYFLCSHISGKEPGLKMFNVRNIR